ncbi:putative F-box protein At1g33530 [Apium graveolens]|uniref:F-box domain-containing protein n=1 Tax=Apium graveolens TaxID=4045 RepID=A0A6L5BB42_APIGR|nr:hypothetical protein AG4045_007711 [Apium graveolens]
MESFLIGGYDTTEPLKKKAKLMHLPSCTNVRRTTELPEEIMNEEILVRLPVEDLLRVRCVCKSWESLFFTPNFVQAHFRNTLNKNSVYRDCLVARKSFGFSLLSRYKETMIHPPRPKVHALCNSRLVGSINGLLCLVHHNEFFLWNPIIGRYRSFTIPREYVPNVDNRSWPRYRYLIGFCWDCMENNYQVIVCYIFSSFRQGVVYSSNSNSWTKLVVPKFVFPSRVFESASGIEQITPTTIVNECPYWCYSRFLPKMRRKYTAIIKFEVQTQKFRSLPEIDYALVRGQNYNFANFKDCLAIMVYRSESPKTAVEIYILHEKSGVWNKVFTIGSPQSNLNIGSLLQGFKFGDEIVIQVIDKVFCYDLQSDEVKGFLGSSNQCEVLECFSYTASFVFLEGMERVQSRTIEEVVV